MSQARSSVLSSSARSHRLRHLGLLDGPPEPAFDRLTQLAARILKAPVVLVSLVDQERQFFKSSAGLGGPSVAPRETPLSQSLCQYVVGSGQNLIIEDARTHPLARESLSIGDFQVVAYAGIPLITRDGHPLGSFCAIDSAPRAWSADEIATLEDLAAAVTTEIELRAETADRAQAEADARLIAEQRQRLLEVAHTMVSSLTLDQLLPQIQRTLQAVLAHDTLTIYWLDEAAGLLRPALATAQAGLGQGHAPQTIALGQGIAGTIGQAGRAELVNSAHLDPRSTTEPGAPQPPPQHLIGLPLFAKDHLRGVCIVGRSGGQSFTAQEFDLAQLYISFVALAIENAHLFEQSRLAEERFSKAFHASPGAITITSLATGRFVDVNDAFLELMGFHRDEVIGRTAAELQVWYNPQQRQQIAQALQQHSVHTHELTFRTKSGAPLHTLASMEIIELDGEHCILALTQDITIRIQAQAAQQADYTFRNAIIERAAEGLCVGHTINEYPYIAFTVWNDRMVEMTGYSMAEINQRGWYQSLFPDPAIRARAIERMEQRHDGNELLSEEWAIAHAGGAPRVVTISTSGLTSSDGTTHVLALINDITDRKRAEAALRESEERFKAIYEHAPVMIDAFTDDNRCLLWNKECERQFGYSIAEVRASADPLQLFYPDPEVRKAIAQSITRPDGVFRECQARTKDGSIRDQMWANFALPNNMIIGVGYDITDSRRAEQEQRRLISELQEALVNVKTLRGLLPICASCKKIRDDQGYWNQLESYIKTHSEADFTHGICPDCVQRLYGEFYNE